MEISRLSDRELLSELKRLVRCEREATARLVAHLAEFDQRRLYLAEGCSSLFTYCTQVLHLSEHAAYGRIEAARAARRFPVILDLLARGVLNLTAVGLLAPHLTAENHRELLDAARCRSKRQVEELVARVRPEPCIPTSIRKLPAPRPVLGSLAALAGSALTSASAGGEPAAVLEATVSPGLRVAGAESSQPPALAAIDPPRRAVVSPLAPERYRVQFTATAEMYEKLRRAQDLLRHQIPDGDAAAVFDRALTVLLQHLERTKLAATRRPRVSRGTAPSSRHIPAAVRRAVWKRDDGRCAFVSRSGRRCGEPGFLEFHHVSPYGDGGEATTENIELRCRAHNRYEAEMYYGQSWVPREKRAVGRQGSRHGVNRGRSRDRVHSSNASSVQTELHRQSQSTRATGRLDRHSLAMRSRSS